MSFERCMQVQLYIYNRDSLVMSDDFHYFEKCQHWKR